MDNLSWLELVSLSLCQENFSQHFNIIYVCCVKGCKHFKKKIERLIMTKNRFSIGNCQKFFIFLLFILAPTDVGGE